MACYMTIPYAQCKLWTVCAKKKLRYLENSLTWMAIRESEFLRKEAAILEMHYFIDKLKSIIPILLDADTSD